jgi:hypothetical protein
MRVFVLFGIVLGRKEDRLETLSTTERPDGAV